MSILELCLIHRVGRPEPRQRNLALLGDTEMTTDLKTVLGDQCHWLSKGTKVKIIAGSREGYIGYIVEVLHLAVQGCIYRVVPTKGMCGIDSRGYYYTQEQVVEYTQVEFCAGGAK